MNSFFLLFLLPFFAENSVAENAGSVIYTYKNGTTEHISMLRESFIPDHVHENINILVNNAGILILSWCLANIIIMTFISQVLYGKKRTNAIIIDSEEDDSNSDDGAGLDLDDLNSTEITYESQYFDKLEELPDTVLGAEELKALLEGQRLTESTPKGIVVMSYNVNTGAFDYYTDKFADISYEILDTVARLFAVTFECKQICVNYRDEIQNGENRMLSEIEFDKMQKEKEKTNDNKERSIFATFKSYNKKRGTNVDKKYYIITDKANRFKYKGKMSDYEKTLSKNATEDVNANVKISYSEYKRMQESANNMPDMANNMPDMANVMPDMVNNMPEIKQKED
uniref:Uncharacterized protein n=1 Tax=viral metagenome TaxID=1070528 RepID=A0A6C0II99_9ZZZZ